CPSPSASQRAGTSPVRMPGRATLFPLSRPERRLDSPPVAGRTQEALYAELDLELSWSEHELPQVERTKHVHSLHPYLGKFIPQLVDAFLERHFERGACVYDPFAGSGTTLVEANVFGAPAIGCDFSGFICLLASDRTARYSLGAFGLALKGALEGVRKGAPASLDGASDWLRAWFAPCALSELLAYRDVIKRLE